MVGEWGTVMRGPDSRLAWLSLGSGVLVSVTTALGSALLCFGSLSGPLPYVVGAAGGLISIPVLAAQAVARRLERRPSPMLIAAVVPWTVAPLAAFVLAASLPLLAKRAGPALREVGRAAGDGCRQMPGAETLGAGSWTLDLDAAGRPTLRVELAGRESITWTLVDDADARGPITRRCELRSAQQPPPPEGPAAGAAEEDSYGG
jgi:hypothetical protein